MTEAHPCLRIDASIPSIVEHATQTLIDDIISGALLALDAAEEEGAEFEFAEILPLLTPDILRDWLSSSITRPEDGTSYLEEAYIECIIGQKVASLFAAQTTIDIAIHDFFRRNSVAPSRSLLFVNVPQVVEALGSFGAPEGFVTLVPIPNFYESPPIVDDERVDVVMGVVRWNGVYICRPVLASLEALGDKLISAIPIKTPTVSYTATAGLH